ncbi:MAG: hypothetical protein ACQ9MH_11615 [Nitrospinales bacterium]
MEANPFKKPRVLAIDPTYKGFGFVVFEGSLSPIDWAVKKTKEKDKNRACLKQIEYLIDFYSPDVIVVEDYSCKGFRRGSRAKDLIKDILKLATKNKTQTFKVSHSMVKEFFSNFGSTTKYDISKTIAEWVTELNLEVPNFRKPWMSEHYRMSIFDAVAFAQAYYYFDMENKGNEII